MQEDKVKFTNFLFQDLPTDKTDAHDDGHDDQNKNCKTYGTKYC